MTKEAGLGTYDERINRNAAGKSAGNAISKLSSTPRRRPERPGQHGVPVEFAEIRRTRGRQEASEFDAVIVIRLAYAERESAAIERAIADGEPPKIVDVPGGSGSQARQRGRNQRNRRPACS